MNRWWLAAALAGCWNKPAPAPAQPAAGSSVQQDAAVTSVDAAAADAAATTAGPVTVELRIDPASVTMAERKKMVVSYVITNVTSATLDPDIRHVALLIDGTANNLFQMSNANGGQDPKWRALPPGEHTGRDLQIAETLFLKPGTYAVKLRAKGVESATVQVRIAP